MKQYVLSMSVAMGLIVLSPLGAADALAGQSMAQRVADALAVERVYHEHRTGQKRPFEEAVPRDIIEAKVLRVFKKEAVLKARYGVEITPAMVAIEIARIDANTRAPAMLAEIKAALDHDPDRFASAMVRPLLAERHLQARFENDDVLHAGRRVELAALRARLLETAGLDGRRTVLEQLKTDAKKMAVTVSERRWQLGPRPDPKEREDGGLTLDELPSEIGPLGPDAKILSSPAAPRDEGKEETWYFEDLGPQLQKVLSAQLKVAGDVSAVIDWPQGFTLFLATEKTGQELVVLMTTLRKLDYAIWLSAMQEGKGGR